MPILESISRKSAKMNIFLRIAFHGADFYGTQKQKDKPTIQGLFEDLLSKIYNTPIKVTISSRLDRFVSALDFGLTFFSPNDKYTLSYLAYYLKRMLPSSVVLLSIEQKEDGFSARYSVKEKTYKYLIQNEDIVNPLFTPFTFVPKRKLNEEKRKEALALFPGIHDFSSFSVPEEDDRCILKLNKAIRKKEKNRLVMTFKGKSFLRYQIRCRVGACIQYQEGKISLDKIQSLLRGEEANYHKNKAEAKGLILWKTDYGREEKKNSSSALGKLI